MDLTTHEHNGIDSKNLPARSIINVPQPAISDIVGGATVDSEARVAIASILDALRTIGIIRT